MTLSTSVHDTRRIGEIRDHEKESDDGARSDLGPDRRARRSRLSSRGRQPRLRRVVRYLISAAVVALAGVVYQQFGHGVRSDFMTYAYTVPLLLGALPATLIFVWRRDATSTKRAHPDGRVGRKRAAAQLGAALWACGIATLTIGSLLQGALEIYGTASGWMIWYLWAGVALLAGATMVAVVGRGSGGGSGR